VPCLAVLLEYGTGEHGPTRRAYMIRPKRIGGVLRFYSRRAGRWVFSSGGVLNPGQHAQRPLATGAALTEHELGSVLQVDLEEWRAMVETIARAANAAHRQ
jgi:hypothetical protein